MGLRSERTDNVNFCFCFLPLFSNSGIIVYLALEGQGWGRVIGTQDWRGAGRVGCERP